MSRQSASPQRARVRRGFTLVELLVVIGIIALLIGILMPALSKARAQGQWAACLSNLKQLGNAMVLYAGENKQYLPRPASNGAGEFDDDLIIWREATPGGASPSGKTVNDSVLAKYLNVQDDKLKTIFRCPNDDYENRPPQAGYTYPYRYSFTMNQSWKANTATVTNPIIAPRPKLTQVRRPAEKVLLVEEKNPNDGLFNYNAVGAGGSDELCDRHTKQGNVLFHDMHVDRRYWKELQDLGNDNVFDITKP